MTPKTFLRVPLLLCVSFVALGCANGMFYQPSRVILETPMQQNLQYERVFFPSLDGTRLSGWFLPAAGKPIGTVIHFHGNAQNMSAHYAYARWMVPEGFNVFVFDYRGYGQSEGKPGRRGIYKDCVAAIRYVRSRKDMDPDKIVLFGQSLGGALALAVMGEEKPAGVRAVASDSAFYSYRTLARDKMSRMFLLSLFRWPLSFFVVTNGHSPGPVIGKISPVPVLLIHGTEDAVVPYGHGKRLFEAAREPKTFLRVFAGRHTDALTRFGDLYKKELVSFFTQALTEPAAGQAPPGP